MKLRSFWTIVLKNFNKSQKLADRPSNGIVENGNNFEVLLKYYLREKYMIRKVKEGYRVVAKSGRNMGSYRSLKKAKQRLGQIEFFKHLKKKK